MIYEIYTTRTYQNLWHNMCRHTPTCSEYGIEAIKIHGSLKGSYLTFKRILKCNPFGSCGFDPVPERKKK